jgi:hypothetical protein
MLDGMEGRGVQPVNTQSGGVTGVGITGALAVVVGSNIPFPETSIRPVPSRRCNQDSIPRLKIIRR